MSEIDNEDTVEKIIHQAFHTVADKYGIDVDTIASIIKDYNEIVSSQLEGKGIISEN
uniref:Uncharacterized protein n=1 Tax=viral metagenome TaxID=1070528 RepID=A0A6M3IDR1_9ZZZZ